jgi:hypothetical protein
MPTKPKNSVKPCASLRATSWQKRTENSVKRCENSVKLRGINRTENSVGKQTQKLRETLCITSCNFVAKTIPTKPQKLRETPWEKQTQKLRETL